tara:strand:- start:648 stop:818 length:171 start_codon:yes stop_codon:yes gene_type:complete
MKNLLTNISIVIVAIFGTTNILLFAALLELDKPFAFVNLTLAILSLILIFLTTKKN